MDLKFEITKCIKCSKEPDSMANPFLGFTEYFGGKSIKVLTICNKCRKKFPKLIKNWVAENGLKVNRRRTKCISVLKHVKI